MPTYTNTLRLNDGIISVVPLPTSEFSSTRAYEYVSEGVAPNVLHARDALQTPDGTLLNANAIFFETEVNNNSNPPVFRQQVIDGALSDGEIKIQDYQTFVPFTIPGVVDARTTSHFNTGTGTKAQHKSIGIILESPVQTEVQATVYEFIQTASTLDTNDYSYQSAEGLWYPNSYGSIRAFGNGGSGSSVSSFYDSQDFRGYRIKNVARLARAVTVFGSSDSITYNGVTRLIGQGLLFEVLVENSGPPDPTGKKWVLDIDLAPAFYGADGTQYYKKTIVVTDAIPSKVNNDVPYK